MAWKGLKAIRGADIITAGAVGIRNGGGQPTGCPIRLFEDRRPYHGRGCSGREVGKEEKPAYGSKRLAILRKAREKLTCVCDR